MWKGLFAVLIGAVALSAPGNGQVVDQARGSDQSVDYASLTRYGPWDDRNYSLTAEDLELLAPDEAGQRVAIPAFYRVELRRGDPAMRHSGPAQYPRSALRKFFTRYGGYLVDGKFHLGASLEDGRYVVDLEAPRTKTAAEDSWVALSSDVRVTAPAGAETSAVAIHPTDPNLVIAGSNGPLSGQTMHYSSDGGATWNEAPPLAGSTCCNPSVGWASDGYRAYAATLAQSGENGIWFYRSSDDGQTWTDLGTLPQMIGSPVADSPRLHVDIHPFSPNVETVYLAWNESEVVKFARSISFGSSWSTPIPVASGDGQFGSGGDITTDRSGDVYYFWPAFDSTGSAGSRRVLVARSTDRGLSFGSPIEVAPTQGIVSFPIPSQETRDALIYVSAGADLSSGPYADSLYVAWTDATSTPTAEPADNHARIRLAYSRNGGASWTVVTPHETDDLATVDRWHPWLAVGADGTVHLVFYDTRRAVDRTAVDLFYTRSTDGGQTFMTPRRLSSEQSPNISNALEFGDYNGLGVYMNDVIGTFTDNRDESLSGAESRDIYAAGVIACTASATVTISSEILGGTQAEDRRSCGTLTADPDVGIAAGFPVWFRARDLVVLGEGFSVVSGADFAVEVNPALIAESD